MYIEHVTLLTGHTRQSPRSEVDDATLALVAPWLDAAVKAGHPTRHALPVPALSQYSISTTHVTGALLATVWAPIGPHVQGKPFGGACEPIVTIGVAQRSRHASDMWPLLLQIQALSTPVFAQKPRAPCCVVVLHPPLIARSQPLDWLGDFQRCVAWAWITRNPHLQASK